MERKSFGYWGYQKLCVRYLSANLQPAGTPYVEDLFISPTGLHLTGPACPAGYVPRGDTTDCGHAYCVGVQRLCVKYAGLPW